MTREQALAILSKGIKAYRRRLCITQDRLGEMLGTGKANVSQMERGLSAPSIEGIFTLFENGMTVEEFFGKEIAAKASARPEGATPIEKTQIVKQGLQELLGMLNGIDLPK